MPLRKLPYEIELESRERELKQEFRRACALLVVLLAALYAVVSLVAFAFRCPSIPTLHTREHWKAALLWKTVNAKNNGS